MKFKTMFSLLIALSLAGCLTQSSIPGPIRAEVTCPCDCHLTIERCEIEDPECKTREAVTERISTLMEEGYTQEEVIAYFEPHKITPVQKLQRQIAAQYESKTPFILYFYSSSCSTCIKVRAKIEEIEQEFPSVTLFKIEKRSHDAVFTQFGVETYPVLIVVINGTEYRKSFSEHDDILSFVQELLG